MRLADLFSVSIFMASISSSSSLEIINEDCWSKGACLQSVLINAINAEDPLTCENFCQTQEGCKWFTYYGNQGICAALSDCNVLDNVENTLSGPSECSGQAAECNLNGRCTGILIGLDKAESVENCQEICQNYKDCHWFTFDSALKSCFAFQDCASIDTNCQTCTSSQVNCKSNPGSDNVILIGGGLPLRNALTNGQTQSNYFEAFDTNGGSSPVEPLPFSIYGAVATLAYGVENYKAPLVCGGVQYSQTSNKCYSLYNTVVNWITDELEVKWKESTSMNTARAFAASVKVLEAGMTNEENWWVSGGEDKMGNPLKSSELRWSNGTWGAGPVLPVPITGHCVVQIQRDLSVIIGGKPYHDNYIYNWRTRKWSTFYQLQTSRFYHGCGLIRNNVLGSGFDQDIIVVGGASNTDENVLKSTEIYKSDVNNWEIGPDFPTGGIYGVAIVQYSSDTILAVGGAASWGGDSNPVIYSLSKSNMAEWVPFGPALVGRYAHIALSVPRTFFNATEVA